MALSTVVVLSVLLATAYAGFAVINSADLSTVDGQVLTDEWDTQDPMADNGMADMERACCGLGCFESGGKFRDIKWRPISVVPDCSLEDKIKLVLNTRQTSTTDQIVTLTNETSVQVSGFKFDKPVKFLVHGFIDSYTQPVWKKMVAGLLKKEDCNVVRVDWSAGNAPPYYRATANTRLVGAYIGKFMLMLKDDFRMNTADMHVIGHSLGAHIAGYAGKYMKTEGQVTLGRITGLDPAGPYFTNMPEEARLSYKDAKVVDTIITDGELIMNSEGVPAYGSPQSFGHMNFRPNSGKNQPGCKSELFHKPMEVQKPRLVEAEAAEQIQQTEGSLGMGGLFAEITGPACNHHRAVVLFIESLDASKTPMKAFQCENFEKFLAGRCLTCSHGGCSVMGIDADLSLAQDGRMKNFFTNTMTKSPFCAKTVRVDMTFSAASANVNAEEKSGQIYVNVHGKKASTGPILVNAEAMNLVPGKTYSAVFETALEVGAVQRLELSWKAAKSRWGWSQRQKTGYIYLDSDVRVMDDSQVVTTLRLTRTKVQENDVVTAISTTAN